MTSTSSHANITNWRTQPHSRWAFHNVGDIIPTAVIPASQVPWILREATMALEGFALTLPSGGGMSLDRFLQATATDAIVVLHDGQIVFETYANGTTRTTPHILMSATKSVVGLLAEILAAKGVLRTDALVSDYVPEICKSAYAGAMIRDLLDMRTGLLFSDAELKAYTAATQWERLEPGAPATGFADFFSGLAGKNSGHGGAFKYLSPNTDLLGWAIERATGQTIATLISTHLWQPLGAETDAAITLDRKGLARCTGGLCATARDLARLGQLLVEGGARDGKVVVPATVIDDIVANADRTAWRDGEWGKSFSALARQMAYGSGWYIIDDAPQTLFAMGIHGQNLFVDRSNRLVVAKLSSQAEPIDFPAIGLTHMAVAAFRRCLTARA